MTAPEHTPHPSTAPRAPAGSEPSPVARRPYVTAILVARATPHTVVGALAALAAQTRGIDALVVLDFTHGTDLAAQVRATTGPGSDLPEALLVADTPSADLGPAINRLVAGLPPVATPAVEWLWLVADDVHPEPDALSRLVDAVRRSPSVGVAGPKVLDRARPRLLVEVGHQLTRSGRVIAAPASGERRGGPAARPRPAPRGIARRHRLLGRGAGGRRPPRHRARPDGRGIRGDLVLDHLLHRRA